MAVITFLQAINQAIIEEMRRDESVIMMGEDIRRAIYGATAGLLDEFGEKRVLDTPLSENGFFGAAIGAAVVGMRPIVETLSSFMWVGMDQIVSQAAKMRYMFGGQASIPVVFRATMYYGGGAAAHHSDRNYPMFMNVPGLKIAVPSCPADAKGLLKTAVRDDDPCLFFEDGTLFGVRGEVPDGEALVPFGEANALRRGTDCTVVAIAGSARESGVTTLTLSLARALAQAGKKVALVDANMDDPQLAERLGVSVCAGWDQTCPVRWNWTKCSIRTRPYSVREKDVSLCFDPTKPWASSPPAKASRS